jgi:multiple antibiotic resistance protein
MAPFESFLLCFIPLLVAIDPVGLLPIFTGVTIGRTPPQRRALVLRAIPVALAIGVVFFSFGFRVLRFMNIELSDLQIAGGILLFIFAMLDLVLPGKPAIQESESVGIVPLATPLIVGPAVLTLGLVLVQQHGLPLALAALVANLVILSIVLLSADFVLRIVPVPAMKAISKVLMLLLAAIGVSLVRTGVLAIVHGA